MYKVAFQLRAAADSANNKVEDVIRAAAHPQINKRLVSATQRFGRSITEVNHVKFDPTLIRVTATKYPAKYVHFNGFYIR